MAGVTAYTAFDMLNASLRNRSLQTYNNTQTLIADGLNTGVYRGNFTYGGFGSLSGPLDSFETRFNSTISHANAVWYAVSGAGVIVKADVTGDRVVDFEIRVNDVASPNATDFLL